MNDNFSEFHHEHFRIGDGEIGEKREIVIVR